MKVVCREGRFGCDWVHVDDIAACVAATLRTDGSADRNRVVHCAEGFAYQQDLAACAHSPAALSTLVSTPVYNLTSAPMCRVAAMALGVTPPSREPLNPPRGIASSGASLGVATLGNASGVHWERAGRFLAYLKVLAEATEDEGGPAL